MARGEDAADAGGGHEGRRDCEQRGHVVGERAVDELRDDRADASGGGERGEGGGSHARGEALCGEDVEGVPASGK